jgi:hypothetical protein
MKLLAHLSAMESVVSGIGGWVQPVTGEGASSVSGFYGGDKEEAMVTKLVLMVLVERGMKLPLLPELATASLAAAMVTKLVSMVLVGRGMESPMSPKLVRLATTRNSLAVKMGGVARVGLRACWEWEKDADQSHFTIPQQFGLTPAFYRFPCSLAGGEL